MSEEHLGGAYLDCPDSSTFMPDIWEHLIFKYNVKSVVDIGCGAGYSTKWFANRFGVENVWGIEGWSEAIEKSQCPKCIVRHDYTKGVFDSPREFDLAWLAEFVEHVEEQFIPNWMATVKKCRYVCMTHGEPGQAGHHHVTCKPTEFWIEKFKENGFIYDPFETVWLRSTDFYHAPWGRKSLCFFSNKCFQ